MEFGFNCVISGSSRTSLVWPLRPLWPCSWS